MRTDDTPAEARLWSLLRARRFNGWKFRRQHAVGRFILDFYCHDAGLGVELDGSQHAQPEAAAYDEFRTRLLSRDNIRILRFSNAEVKRHMLRVAEAIWLELNKED